MFTHKMFKTTTRNRVMSEASNYNPLFSGSGGASSSWVVVGEPEAGCRVHSHSDERNRAKPCVRAQTFASRMETPPLSAAFFALQLFLEPSALMELELLTGRDAPANYTPRVSLLLLGQVLEFHFQLACRPLLSQTRNLPHTTSQNKDTGRERIQEALYRPIGSV